MTFPGARPFLNIIVIACVVVHVMRHRFVVIRIREGSRERIHLHALLCLLGLQLPKVLCEGFVNTLTDARRMLEYVGERRVGSSERRALTWTRGPRRDVGHAIAFRAGDGIEIWAAEGVAAHAVERRPVLSGPASIQGRELSPKLSRKIGFAAWADLVVFERCVATTDVPAVLTSVQMIFALHSFRVDTHTGSVRSVRPLSRVKQDRRELARGVARALR